MKDKCTKEQAKVIVEKEIEENLKNYNSEMQKAMKNITDDVEEKLKTKDNATAQDDMEHEKLIEEILKEMNDRQQRENKIVVIRVPEATVIQKKDRIKTDKEFMRKMSSKCGLTVTNGEIEDIQ
jgi:hypothetical protein